MRGAAPRPINSAPHRRISIWAKQALGAAWAHVCLRTALWRALSRDSRHPLAPHLGRKLRQGKPLSLLKVSLAHCLTLACLATWLFSALAEDVVWALPLLLMLFSAPYCAIWIARVSQLMSRQRVGGARDQIGLIPPGPVFVHLTICKVALNQDDAVAWLALLRRVLAFTVMTVLLLTMCLVMSLLRETSAVALGALLLDLCLAAAVMVLEHSQSTVLACLVAVTAATRAGAYADKASVAIGAFFGLQAASYALPLAALSLLGEISVGAAFALFLLLRELLVAALWRLILEEAGEGGSRCGPAAWRESLLAEESHRRAH